MSDRVSMMWDRIKSLNLNLRLNFKKFIMLGFPGARTFIAEDFLMPGEKRVSLWD
ncbi:MAG: hypothetical protein DHS20C08_18430 [Rhodomicrobium sp.]|nr:MAG: hypothetical protein DHS20C08_18430 [Rhodomicrobium sp.]